MGYGMGIPLQWRWLLLGSKDTYVLPVSARGPL